MAVKSCLYPTRIMHHRLTPKEHRFEYRFFSFYLDLDEVDQVVSQSRLISRQKFNWYGFYEEDHILKKGMDLKNSVLAYLKEQGIDLPGGRIMLLTNLRMAGYVFNPVSFFYCFDHEDKPVCVLVEIGNTFKELKYFLIKNHPDGAAFKSEQTKYYYISPFTHLDDQLEFALGVPQEKLNIHINTKKNQGDRVVVTSMMGERVELNDKALWTLTWSIPLVTLKTIVLIHWHAFRLWMKGVPYEEKSANQHWQKGVYRVSK